jgi:hypothetical protein
MEKRHPLNKSDPDKQIGQTKNTYTNNCGDFKIQELEPAEYTLTLNNFHDNPPIM